MLDEIKRFMQSQDRNGTWYDATGEDVPYILETLENWIDDGLNVTPRISIYIDYLKNGR